jgi:hypothetical protein
MVREASVAADPERGEFGVFAYRSVVVRAAEERFVGQVRDPAVRICEHELQVL